MSSSNKNNEGSDGHRGGGSRPLIFGNPGNNVNARKAWQILDKSADNNSVEITAQGMGVGGEKDRDSDLEAGNLNRIDVKKEFGSETTVV